MGTDGEPSSQLRYVALDGLRGVAALIVVFGHLFGTLPMDPFARRTIAQSPLGLLFNGHAAVHVFFVLSGFVLTGSLLRWGEISVRGLPGYLVRRAWRLHPPYVAGVLFAWCASAFYPDPRSMGPTSLALPWARVNVPATELLGIVTSIPNAAAGLLPVGWTLRVESIFSCLLPLLVGVQMFHPAYLIAAVASLMALPMQLRWPFFALDFGIGILLFRYRVRVERRGPMAWLGAAILVAGLVLIQLPLSLGWYIPGAMDRKTASAMAVGSGLIVTSALHWTPFAAALSGTFCRYLGRVSYSLYLVHIPVILLVAGRVPADTHWVTMITVAAGCTVVSLAIATLFEKIVEIPSQRLGRRMAHWLDDRLTVRSPTVPSGHLQR